MNFSAPNGRIHHVFAKLDSTDGGGKDDVIWGEDNVQTRYLITKGRADTEDSVAAIDDAIAACEVVVSGIIEFIDL